MPEPRNQFLKHYSLNQAQLEGVAPWDDLEFNLNGVRVFRDRYPVTEGHLLFVPEYDAIDNITEAFRMALIRGTAMVRRGDCDAFNIGINMGTEAGQTVMYPHVHLIPRRAGDVADPTGGVRGVIPGRSNFFDLPETQHPMVLVRGISNKFNILCPVGGFGNHVRWLILLDPAFQFYVKVTEDCYRDHQGPDWPRYDDYKHSKWNDTRAEIREEILSLLGDYDCIDTDSKLRFIQDKVYFDSRSWDNWLITEWYYRKNLDNLIQLEHLAWRLRERDLPILNLTIDPELAYRSYLKFNSNLNITTNQDFRQYEVQSVVESNTLHAQNVPGSLTMQTDVLFRPELDRDFYHELITWAGLSDQYDAANQVHQLWYQAHRRCEHALVNDLIGMYGKSTADPA